MYHTLKLNHSITRCRLHALQNVLGSTILEKEDVLASRSDKSEMLLSRLRQELFLKLLSIQQKYKRFGGTSTCLRMQKPYLASHGLISNKRKELLMQK